jgi:hypothetical protein
MRRIPGLHRFRPVRIQGGEDVPVKSPLRHRVVTCRFERAWVKKTSSSTESDFPAVPQDLAEWVGAVRLMQLTLEATEGVRVGSDRFATGRSGEVVPTRMLFSLLAYAYARGIYASQDVEDAVARLADFRYLASGDVPNLAVLRRFRRENWTELLGVLTRLLVAVVDIQTPGSRAAAELEAEDRLVAAVQADSLAAE